MIDRRAFLLSGIGLAFAFPNAPGLARRKSTAIKSGIRSIFRQDWPPAIVPDRAQFLDNGLSIFADQFGKIAIVEFKGNADPRVLGQLSVPGNKLIDFVALRHRAYALALQDSASSDGDFALSEISLTPETDPSILARISPPHFSEVTCLTATAEFVCVGGATAEGAGQVAIFSPRGKTAAPTHIASLKVSQPVTKIDLQGRNLVVLESGETSQIDYVNLADPQAPKVRKTIKLNGDYRVIARVKDALMVAGLSGNPSSLEVKSINLEPAPHVVDSHTLAPSSSVIDAAAQRDQFFFLCEDRGEPQLISLKLERDFRITPEQRVGLPGGKISPGVQAQLAVRDRCINIASGWHGVDVLNYTRDGWSHTLTYNIPRLPASSVATFDNLMVLAGADLKLYDIRKPDKPLLMSSAEPSSAVKSMIAIGPFVVCLTKNSLSLRKIENLLEPLATIDIKGQDMSFDPKARKAYILQGQDKKTTVTPVNVYSDRLLAQQAIDLPQGLRRILVLGGNLVMASLSDIVIFDTVQNAMLSPMQTLANLAIRDIALANDHLFLTAVDKSSKGYLIVMSTDAGELKRVGAVDLPQDGVALAVSDTQAVVIGRDDQGHNLASIVDISVPALPKIIATLPSVDVASAVTIKNHLAIVVGRGLSILSLG